MSDIETTVKMPQVPTVNVIPSIIDISSTKSYEDIEARTCPLCRSEVRLFFINFNDKMLMCENTECEFPFGYEELVFVKEAEGMQSHVEIDTQSMRTKMVETPACSVLSTACWSEIEKINRAYDSEESQAFESKALEPKEYMSLKNLKRRPKEVIDENSISKSLKEIKALNTKIEDSHPTVIIKNEKFLKNLFGLQSKAKSNHTIIMKPEEIKLVQAEPEPSTSGVTFNIKAGEGSLSTININITEVEQPKKSGGDTSLSAGDSV